MTPDFNVGSACTPRHVEITTISFEIPPRLLQQIEAAMDKNGESLALFFYQAARERLERMRA